MWFDYFVFMISMLLFDSIWLFGGKEIHLSVVERVQKSPLKANIYAALLFYALAPIVYIFFVQKLAKDIKSAFLYGMLIGLLMYGTFDLSNKAIFTAYPWKYAIVDMTWGTALFGIVSAITFLISHSRV